MKLFSTVQCVAVAGFVFLLAACSSESVIVDPSVSANSSSEIVEPSSSSEIVDSSSSSEIVESSSSSEIVAISSSPEAVYSSSSEQEPFNPSDYRTCDEKYEGKFLMYQYTKVLDVMGTSFIIATDFYKCESGKWSEPITNANPWMEKIGGDAIDRNVIDGDVIRVAPDEWVCSAENEGLVQSWSYMYAANHAPGRTPTYYARCEQGDWILCDEPTSSSSVPHSSSSSDQVTDVSSSSFVIPDGWSWDVPKDLRLNPEIEYDSITDSRDGKVYKTVKIGAQTWMAENLNFDPGQGGTGEGKYDWSWCYNKEPKNCNVAGRLYTWAAAIDSVKLANDVDNPRDCGDGKKCTLPDTVFGICPSGWHLPSKAEFEMMVTAVGGLSTAGKALKSQTGWNERGNGTDNFGFSALPVGGWAPLYDFYLEGIGAYFWSATADYDGYADHLSFEYDKNDAHLDFSYKYNGSSVRCVKN